MKPGKLGFGASVAAKVSSSLLESESRRAKVDKSGCKGKNVGASARKKVQERVSAGAGMPGMLMLRMSVEVSLTGGGRLMTPSSPNRVGSPDCSKGLAGKGGRRVVSRTTVELDAGVL